ncbi:type II toxin-antitoxin system RelE/ParE family toxin [Elongatibacter sediminis]|uniref:Type II toxin-antitoxin system RelE/ParE family toxin n=1 Tax=Elongatibacter sediminis TaxID=3119006 RepID=A0AAW9RHY1_9GAMM
MERLALGNPGQHRTLKHGVMEMKVDFGPGYRVYFIRRREVTVILLCGGDKSSQRADILRAYSMARELKPGSGGGRD